MSAINRVKNFLASFIGTLFHHSKKETEQDLSEFTIL